MRRNAGGRFALAALACAVLWAWGAQSAQADLSFCPTGSGAGQCSGAEGLATDFEDGRLYVADKANNRVDVFKAETGEFLFAFGWGVDTGAAELQKCTTASSCQAGLSGTGAGQLSSPSWIAVDNSAGASHHDIYVSDADYRVAKFDKDGNFLLMFGKVVNSGTSGKADLCTNAGPPTDVCGAGSAGVGAGQFEDIRGIGVSGAGTAYVVDTKSLAACEGNISKGSEFFKRVQKYNEAGERIEEVVPSDVPCGQINGFAVESGGAYWIVNKGGSRALRRYLPSATSKSCEADPGVETEGIGVDNADKLFAAQREAGLPGAVANMVTELDSSCAHLRRFGYGKIAGITPPGLAALHTAGGDVMVSEVGKGIHYLDIPDPGPIVANTEVVPPVGNTKATVRAWINPEGKATDFHFEYVDEADYEADVGGGGNGFEGAGVKSGAVKALVIAVGKEFNAISTGEELLGCAVATEQLIAEGKCLSPGTEYHWRVIATNADNPGGSGEASKEGLPFTTKPPLEVEVFATDVSDDTATLATFLNPLGFATKGHFEYVSDAAYEADVEAGGDGFAEAIRVPDPLPPAEEAEYDFGSGEAALKRSATVTGLAEGTSYHYRLLANDPFFAELPSEVKTLTTYRRPGIEPCPANEAFRGGSPALLPDCRAYELVSPLDKEGGDIVLATGGDPADQSSLSGGRFTYGSYRAFGDSASSPYTAQYIAEREADGWGSHAINPPKERAIKPAVVQNNEYFHFSDDLCEGTLLTLSEPPLAAEAQPGYINIYRRKDQLCGGAPDYEAVTTAKPEHFGKFTITYALELQGVSGDGQTTIFAASDNLEGSGAPANTLGTQLYIHAAGVPGPPRYVCILPGGTGATSKLCSAGSGSGIVVFGSTRFASMKGALSEDGKRIYWTNTSNSQGKIYLRENPLGEGSECAGPGTPCTLAVSEEGEALTGGESGKAHFWAGAKDGSAALYNVGSSGGGDLYTFTVAGEETQKIAGQSFGVVGASEDLQRIYFVSGEVKTGSEENENKEKAQAGKRNLYLYTGPGAGSYNFIGRLGAKDSGAIQSEPSYHSAQVSADGLQVSFMSEAPLTGFDNTDAASPQACGKAEGICDSEVFLYDASADGGAGQLLCASCNAAGARPAGRNVGTAISPVWVAGRLPGYETTLYQPRVLFQGGKRLIFESQDALTPRDTNQRLDVYQWERVGSGGCKEANASFSAPSHGCIDLLSSGQSKRDSELLDAGSSGDDVFFATLSSLLPYDYGLVDVYDARVGGGLPAPPAPEPECEAEDCQHPAAAPEFQTPASASNEGPGNLEATPKPRRCPKGKHRVKRNGKSRCVKNKAKKAKKHTHPARRGANR